MDPANFIFNLTILKDRLSKYRPGLSGKWTSPGAEVTLLTNVDFPLLIKRL